MARQIIQTQQKDFGEQIGQAIGGATSSYFETLHKGEMRNVERERVSEAVRSNRAGEALSAANIGSNIMIESARDKRQRDIAAKDRQAKAGLQRQAESATLDLWKMREDAEAQRYAQTAAAARSKAAAEAQLTPLEMKYITETKLKWGESFANDLERGATVWALDKDGQPIPGKTQKLKENYPMEMYVAQKFAEDNMVISQMYDRALAVSPEKVAEGAKSFYDILSQDNLSPQDVIQAQERLEMLRPQWQQLPALKHLLARIDERMDFWFENFHMLDQGRADLEQAGETRRMQRSLQPMAGASQFLAQPELDVGQTEPGVYNLGALMKQYERLARGR